MTKIFQQKSDASVLNAFRDAFHDVTITQTLADKNTILCIHENGSGYIKASLN